MISAVMISCRERDHIREETLTNLKSTDWEWDVNIIIDKDYVETSVTDKKERQALASYHALKQALSKPDPWIVFMEDDLIFNKHIAYNIKNWYPIECNVLNLGSLYTPSNNRCSVEDGKYWYKADYLRLYGSQFYIMSRLATSWAVDHWHSEIGMQDIKITRLSRGKEIYYHSPSLVQHRPVSSVWGGVSHQASDFDEDWKHPNEY